MALPAMDRPPLPSPDLQSQMGMPQQPAPAAMGISSVRGGQSPGQAPGPRSVNPHGFLMAQVDAVKAVLKEIAGAEPIFAPFAQRAEQILDTGVSAVSAAPRPTAEGLPPPQPGVEGAGSPIPPPPGGTGQTPPLG